MAPVKPSSSSTPSSSNSGKQPTILGFFKKQAPQTPSTPRAAVETAKKTTTFDKKRPISAFDRMGATASGSTTPRATPALKREDVSSSSTTVVARDASEQDDDMEVDVVQPKVSNSSPQATAVERSPVILMSDDEEEADVRPAPRRSSGKHPLVVDSEEDEPAAKAAVSKPVAKKVKPASSSQDYGLDDDDEDAGFMDAFLVAEKAILEKPVKVTKPAVQATPTVVKSKAKATPAAKATPMAKVNSGSSSKENVYSNATAKGNETKPAEGTYSFLHNSRDADKVLHSNPNSDPRTLYIPPSCSKTFSPFETQFWDIKKNHYDTVLFFQKGKFYEMFENDAMIAHQEFDLKLTERVKMKMCGFPEGQYELWAAKFLAKNHKVGRVDQSETALGADLRQKDAGKAAKGAAKAPKIVRRELKSIATPGTITDGSMLGAELQRHCISIKEYTPDAATAPTFGVCVLDAALAEFTSTTLIDDTSCTALETLMRQHNVIEIVHERGNLSNSTFRMLRSAVGDDCKWVCLKPQVQSLDADATKEALEKMFTADGEGEVPAILKSVYSSKILMEALGGLLWYLRDLQLDKELLTTGNFNIYDPINSEDTLFLDGQTLAHIEVLRNSSGGHDGTLLQLLSRCVTPYGKRLFIVWLCHPLREVAAINERLDAVEELLKHPDFEATFDKMVKGLPDLERLLSRVHAGTTSKKLFLQVMAAFSKISVGVNSLLDISRSFTSPGIANVLAGLPKLDDILERVSGLYYNNKETDELAPVAGSDELFEIAKQRVEAAEEALEDALEGYKKELKCRTASYKDIGTKEIFQIQIPSGTKHPKNWTRMSSTKDFDRYYSPEGITMVAELKEARERLKGVLNGFLARVLENFAQDYPTWMAMLKGVARLDCLLSLSKSSAGLGSPSVRPEIVESDAAIIEFEELRHPCVLSSTVDFIPNDVVLGGDAEQMILLTGPNMAGKSTMLRMTCAAIIMAQLGCFVPASKARISPIDAIYSRMGANDLIFAAASTFKVEMDDTTKILKKATPKSLVILDELGRGTSTYDGMAIAFAVLHRLATHVGCIGFFATHFTSLTEDFAYHPQIRVCNMLTNVDDNTRMVVFLYKLVAGSSPKSYGPHVASMAGLSEVLVQRAISISQEFEVASRAKERQSRASESLPLTSQADAAFLLKLLTMRIDELSVSQLGQLKRTMKMMSDNASQARVVTMED